MSKKRKEADKPSKKEKKDKIIKETLNLSDEEYSKFGETLTKIAKYAALVAEHKGVEIGDNNKRLKTARTSMMLSALSNFACHHEKPARPVLYCLACSLKRISEE